MMNRQLADDKETSTWQQQLNAVEPSATNPIAEDGKEMPRDQHYWNDFVKDRKKSAEQKTVGAKTAAKMAPASQALEFENGGGQAEIAQPPEVPGFAGPGALAAPVTSPPAVVAQAPNRNAAVPAIASADRLGQPARAYAGRAETFGMQTKLQNRALALAPRQQLAPATDGTFDLYATGIGRRKLRFVLRCLRYNGGLSRAKAHYFAMVNPATNTAPAPLRTHSSKPKVATRFRPSG